MKTLAACLRKRCLVVGLVSRSQTIRGDVSKGVVELFITSGKAFICAVPDTFGFRRLILDLDVTESALHFDSHGGLLVLTTLERVAG